MKTQLKCIGHFSCATVVTTLLLLSCSPRILYQVDNCIEFTPSDVKCSNIESSELPVTVLSAREIDVCDSLLIVTTEDKSGYLKIIGTNSLSVLAEICQNGNAGNEFRYAGSSSHFMHSENGDILFDVNDMSHIKRLNITQSVKDQVAVVEESFPYDGLFDKISFCGADSIIFEKQRVRIMINSKGRNLNWNVTEPGYITANGPCTPYNSMMIFQDVPTAVEMMYDGAVGIKPDYTVAVDALFYIDCINLIDLESGRITGIVNRDYPSFKQIDSMSISEMASRLTTNYREIQTFNEYFLLLWEGNTLDEELNENDNKNCEIRVFDWDGNLLERIALDRYARSFSYEPESQTLFLLNDKGQLYSAPLILTEKN
ncbi:MAG: hypothetical protein KBT44_02640 [Bacteroidales bacterium]|nr:hypothetical protein [Candidatus Equibacterium intestinale]